MIRPPSKRALTLLSGVFGTLAIAYSSASIQEKVNFLSPYLPGFQNYYGLGVGAVFVTMAGVSYISRRRSEQSLQEAPEPVPLKPSYPDQIELDLTPAPPKPEVEFDYDKTRDTLVITFNESETLPKEVKLIVYHIKAYVDRFGMIPLQNKIMSGLAIPALTDIMKTQFGKLNIFLSPPPVQPRQVSRRAKKTKTVCPNCRTWQEALEINGTMHFTCANCRKKYPV